MDPVLAVVMVGAVPFLLGAGVTYLAYRKQPQRSPPIPDAEGRLQLWRGALIVAATISWYAVPCALAFLWSADRAGRARGRAFGWTCAGVVAVRVLHLLLPVRIALWTKLVPYDWHRTLATVDGIWSTLAVLSIMWFATRRALRQVEQH